MEFAEERVGDVIIVRLQGKLDTHTAQSARERLTQSIATVLRPSIAVDLSHVRYVSSAGLQALLALARKVRQSNGKLVLFGLLPEISVIGGKIVGLTEALATFEYSAGL